MKRSIIGVALALSLFLAPLAHADTAPVPIGDPYTDTIQLWSEIASELSSFANDFASLFDGQEFAVAHPPTPPAALSAAAASSVSSTSSTAAPATSNEPTPSVTSDQTTLSQNVKSAELTPVEFSSAQSSAPNSTNVIEAESAFNASDFVTQSELTRTLLALSNSLADKSAPTTAPVLPEWVAADGNPFVPYAAASNIGQLSNVTITNANLSASEIPALDYLPLSGGALTGTLSVPTLNASSTNYGVITATNSSTTNLSNTGTAYFGSTGATTIDSAGDLSVAGNTSLLDATSSNLAVSDTASTSNLVVSNSFTLGTLTGILHAAGGVVSASLVNLASDVSGVLPVANGGTGWASLASGYIPFGNGSSGLATSTNLFFDAIDGRLGVGTSSPVATLSVSGSGYFSTLNLGSALSIANGGTGVSIPSVAGFPVEAYGAVGDGSTDDSAAIESAINAACAAHGGKVVFGAKIYAIASGLYIDCPNVYLVGQGAGGPYTGTPSAYTDSNHYGATVLKWTGSSGGTMVTFSPANGAATGLKGGGIDNLVLAGYGVAGTGLQLYSMRGGIFPRLTIENVTQNGLDMNGATSTVADSVYDNQDNYFGQLFIILYWNIVAVRNANGIVLDGDAGAGNGNASFNTFDQVYEVYESGDGVKFGDSDTNTFNSLIAFQPGGYTGPMVEFTASSTATGAARNNTIMFVQNDAGGIIADGNGYGTTGIGSSYNNQILSITNGNGGATVPVIQPGATLSYKDQQGLISGWEGINQSGNISSLLSIGGNASTTLSWTNVGLDFAVQANELIDFASSQGSAIATRVANSFAQPTFSFASGTSTISTAATLYIQGAPLADASSTIITNPFAVEVAGGNSFFNGNILLGTTTSGRTLTISGATAGTAGLRIISGNASTGDTATAELVGLRSDSNKSGTFAGTLALAHLETDAQIATSTLGNLGRVVFGGNYGSAGLINLSNLAYSASIAGVSEGSFISTSSMPTGIAFYTGSTGVALNASNVNIGSERMRISSSGNIGIGATAPYSRLQVTGPDSASSTSAFAVVNSASTTVFSVFDGGNAELSGSLSQSSDQRLKTNVQSLDASSSLSFIDELNPVTFNWIDPNQTTALQLGFIAQQVQQIFPNLVSTTSATALTPGGTLSLNYIGLISPIVSAIQAISAEIASIENTITGFAQSFTSAVGNFGQVNAQNELCVGSTCITPAQFQAMVAAASAPQSSGQGSSGALTEDGAATDTPPVMQINGANPAIIQVGATYNDLGATITGPQQDLNLGITTYVNGTEMSPVQLDTSQAATDTIDYAATDQNGLTSTSTRTVIIAAPSIVPSDNASSTDATTTVATSASS